MANPQNYRAYGVLIRDGLVLIAAEWIGPVFAWKFPGGGVWPEECAEEAVCRELVEEASLDVTILRELHDPGTRVSPWTRMPYTPIYFLIAAEGKPVVPDGETVELSFKEPEQVLASELVADPEKVALRKALGI
jgi:8-oxo-dGTP pyrophosphatase MutT (NUDIX family)